MAFVGTGLSLGRKTPRTSVCVRQTPSASRMLIDAEPPKVLAGVTLTEEDRKAYKINFIDMAKTEAANKLADFPFSEKELIEKCMLLHVKNQGVLDHSLLADDFVFVGPVVGPLSKKVFLNVFGNFDFMSGLPDLRAGIYDIRVDPFMPNRVWFTTQGRGTHSGKLDFGAIIEPTGTKVEMTPQVGSFTFNKEGQATKMTVGYVIDKDVGNCGGLGGIFAVMYAIGKPLPFPEGRPWKMSLPYWLFNKLGSIVNN